MLLQQRDLIKDSLILGFLQSFTEGSHFDLKQHLPVISGDVQNNFGSCLSCFTSRMVPTEFMLCDWCNVSRAEVCRFPGKTLMSPSYFLPGCSVNSTFPGNNLWFDFKSFKISTEFSFACSALGGKKSFVMFLIIGPFNSGRGALAVSSLLRLFRWAGSPSSIRLDNWVQWLKPSDTGVQLCSAFSLLSVPQLPPWTCSSSSSSLLSLPCISPYRFMYFLVAKDILFGEIRLRPTMLLSTFACEASWKEKSGGGFGPERLRESLDNWFSLRYLSAIAFASMLRSTTLGVKPYILTLANDM